MAHTATHALTAVLVVAVTFSSSVLARKPAAHPHALKHVAFASHAGQTHAGQKAAAAPLVAAPASAPQADNDGSRFDYASCGCSGS